jgi:outer membrane protein
MSIRMNTILAAALASTLALAGVAHAQTAAKATAIAVVDVSKVFNDLSERSAIEADINSLRERIQKEDTQRKQELDALQADLRILSPNEEAFKQTVAKAEIKSLEYQAWKQYQQRKIDNETTNRIQDLYNKVLDAIERLAKKDGYDLVLFKDQTESLRGQNPQQITAMIQIRKVLYSKTELDITDQIKQLCNNEYNTRKAAAPAPAAPAAPAKK